MTKEMLLINQLQAKLDAHIKEEKKQFASYATIENALGAIKEFYVKKEMLENQIKELVDINRNINPYINKVNECYEKIQMYLAELEDNNITKRLEECELDIKILKEGGNI